MTTALMIYEALVAFALLVLLILGPIAYRQHKRGRKVIRMPEWRVFDEELGELSHIERAMMRGHRDEHFVPVATALLSPLPQTMADHPAVLTPEQHELAAEHARDKRQADGLGDPQ